MATNIHTLPRSRYTLPALWHLLSLDAPTVAAVWFVMAARTTHLHLNACDVAALSLGTWMLYVVDRMLDARLGVSEQQEERHIFHGTNQFAFLCAMVCAAPALMVLLMHMESALLHAYLLLGVALAAYFALIHTRPLAQRVPKELAVGVIFAAAIFMPEWIARGRGVMPQAICFGGLCWMNCVGIYQREHGSLNAAHWSTRLGIRYARVLLGMLVGAGIWIGAGSRAAGVSIVLSALAMLALHSASSRMTRLQFRIAADAALLTPMLFLLR